MKPMSSDLIKKIGSRLMIGYIDLVYKTSKVSLLGRPELLQNREGEKLVALFWHGDSFSLYPSMKNLDIYIVVTRDRRGDYITDICRHYGYQTLRIPDASEGGNYLFQIRKAINARGQANIAITLDGPIGIYHEPKDFALIVAQLTRRKVMPVTIQVKRKIRMTRRWDKFVIPLPFNRITLCFHEPVEVTRTKDEDPLAASKSVLKEIMETECR